MEYGILTLIPPILTVVLAFLSRQVMLSLIVGLFSGALILTNGNIITAVTDVFTDSVIGAINDSSHAAILVFTLTIGGMTSLLTATGGLQAVAKKLSRKIKSARGAQIITSILGCLVFFDDYANILIVGPTTRPLSDSLNVSREKQTYIVHTTAGVVAGIALMTTWVGFEIGLVTDTFSSLGYDVNGFAMIVRNIPYMFYNILAIVIMFVIAITLKDFGPMYDAEKRARLTGKVVDDSTKISESDIVNVKENEEGKVIYAVLPILTLIAVIFFGIWLSGYNSLEEGTVTFWSFEGLRISFGEADPFPPIVWAAMLSTFVAAIIAKFGKNMKAEEIYQSWLQGFLSLCEAMIILVLAWAIGTVISELGTADYLIKLTEGTIPVEVMPAIVFVISCFISFATGTSWGTMPIMFPIALPVVAALVSDPTNSSLVIATIAAILSGSIFGDQTSPISDSSIISAAATGCGLLEHVKTELPYEAVPAAFAVAAYLLIGILHLSVGIVLLIGIVGIIIFANIFGKSTKKEDLEASVAKSK